MNHYTTLGVASDATQAEIRSAYHAEARKWHPDRFGDASSSELAEAEEAMRRVNEAWRVLGDKNRRASFDRQINLADDVIRVDPSFINRDRLHERRREEQLDLANSQAMVLRLVPWLAFGGLLAGIFVFTAFARGDSAPLPTTVPGPALGVDALACVRIATGPSLVAVPCEGGVLYDGRVIGARFADGQCPTATIREVPLTEDKIACLGQ